MGKFGISILTALVLASASSASANRTVECTGRGDQFTIVIDGNDSLISVVEKINESGNVFHSDTQKPVLVQLDGENFKFSFRSELTGSGSSSYVTLQIPSSLKGTGSLHESGSSAFGLDCN